jgi:AcrR family transcriptional regulator
MSPDRRRTHAERSAETIERLLDAAIEAIVDVGYHRATVTEICARAGVTQGAVFHHFETRVELVLTALERMTAGRIARYSTLAGQRIADGSLGLLRVVGQLARDPVAVVWAEVTVAARTDELLRQRLEPALQARWTLIAGAAGHFPLLRDMPADARLVWLQVMRGVLELAPLVDPFSPIEPSGEAEERRDLALLALAGRLGGDRTET